jgi:hypothetical protein
VIRILETLIGLENVSTPQPAEVTKMTYKCKHTNAERQCITPKNMRLSYIYNGSLTNVKRIHWIFHELPLGTHQDVLPQRRSHMDMVVKKVERAMNITWAKKRRAKHRTIETASSIPIPRY